MNYKPGMNYKPYFSNFRGRHSKHVIPIDQCVKFQDQTFKFHFSKVNEYEDDRCRVIRIHVEA